MYTLYFQDIKRLLQLQVNYDSHHLHITLLFN